MEHQYRGNTHRKYAIGGLNAPNLYFCCCCCFCFGDVTAKTDNCVKINSATKCF